MVFLAKSIYFVKFVPRKGMHSSVQEANYFNYKFLQEVHMQSTDYRDLSQKEQDAILIFFLNKYSGKQRSKETFYKDLTFYCENYTAFPVDFYLKRADLLHDDNSFMAESIEHFLNVGVKSVQAFLAVVNNLIFNNISSGAIIKAVECYMKTKYNGNFYALSNFKAVLQKGLKIYKKDYDRNEDAAKLVYRCFEHNAKVDIERLESAAFDKIYKLVPNYAYSDEAAERIQANLWDVYAADESFARKKDPIEELKERSFWDLLDSTKNEMFDKSSIDCAAQFFWDNITVVDDNGAYFYAHHVPKDTVRLINTYFENWPSTEEMNMLRQFLLSQFQSQEQACQSTTEQALQHDTNSPITMLNMHASQSSSENGSETNNNDLEHNGNNQVHFNYG